MESVFTIAGAADDYVQIAAPPDGPTPTDLMCAQTVKPLFIFGSFGVVAGFGTGLFGTYKLLKGKGAAGVTGLVAAGVLWLAGGMMVRSATARFAACRSR